MFEWVLTSPWYLKKHYVYIIMWTLVKIFEFFVYIFFSFSKGLQEFSIDFLFEFRFMFWITLVIALLTFMKIIFICLVFLIFCKVLFSFMMHVFNYLYKILKLNNMKHFQKILYYERKVLYNKRYSVNYLKFNFLSINITGLQFSKIG